MIKIIKHILLILWCLLIFFFSNESGEVSAGRSETITNNTINTYEEIFNKEVKNKEKVSDNLENIIRKTAHFSLYTVLGILTFLVLKEYPLDLRKQIIYSIIFCILYAISDEIHQIFTSDRGPRILDVLIDTLGSTTGILIILLFLKRNT